MASKKLERNIEDPVVRYARQRGCLVRKMNGLGFRAWPDRLFMGPNGGILWIEFKRPGESATALQLDFHGQMQKLGHACYVVDSVEVGKLYVDRLLRRKR